MRYILLILQRILQPVNRTLYCSVDRLQYTFVLKSEAAQVVRHRIHGTVQYWHCNICVCWTAALLCIGGTVVAV